MDIPGCISLSQPPWNRTLGPQRGREGQEPLQLPLSLTSCPPKAPLPGQPREHPGWTLRRVDQPPSPPTPHTFPSLPPSPPFPPLPPPSYLPEAERWALRLWSILYPPPRGLNQEQMQQREASWAPCSSSHLECAPLDASQGVGRTTVPGWPTSYSVPQGSGTIIQKMTSRCPMAPPYPNRAMKRCFFTME